MKKYPVIFLALAAMLSACGPKDSVIHVKTPARPAGQENVLALATEPLDTVRVGFIGLGMRGPSAVERFCYLPRTRIVALCDLLPENVSKCQDITTAHNRPLPAGYSDDENAWKALCERDDINLVYIATDWKTHAPMALYAMEHGKHVAIEVPAATSLDEIWALVNMAEKKRLHCMMLENCTYDFFELTVLNMARQGVFGDVIHTEGSYHHTLDEFWDRYWSSWRLNFNASHKGDVYPTHGLGPVCQVMGIHRGDRMKTLVAMETRSVVGRQLWADRGNDPDEFLNGDETMTMISTEKGNTILIEHDVMTPRPYDRMYQVVGSKGYAAKYPVRRISVDRHAPLSDAEADSLMAKYRSPILTDELEQTAKAVGGHGGMDFIMDYRLVYCLTNGLPLDMDVYDLAEWCCIGPLGAISIANGGAPVEVPDFTRGAWDTLEGFNYAFAD